MPHTGVPRSLETVPTYEPTVGLCLEPYGGPRDFFFLMSEVALYKTVKAGFWPWLSGTGA